MSKRIAFDNEAHQGLLRGVDKIADAVASTMGPAGRSVVLHHSVGFTPDVSRDGITVAKEVDLLDPLEDAGAQMARGASEKTVNEAGDGTTTSMVLTRAIFREGLKAVAAGANPVSIKRGLDAALEKLIPYLDSIAKPIRGNMIEQVAVISANNDKFIGNIVAEALRTVGASGIVTVEESPTFETSFETQSGMQLNTGYISPYFMTDKASLECVQDSPYVLIVNSKLSVLKPSMRSLFEQLAKAGKSLFLIAEDIEGPVLATLVMNKMTAVNQDGTMIGGWNSCAVKMPAVGPAKKDILMDLAILTGATVIMEDLGLTEENVTANHLGRAKKIITTKNSFTLIEGQGKPDAIAARISEIRAHIASAKTEFEKDRLQERLAKLSGGVAIIKVGASSKIELGEKKARVEDAMFATKCAVEEGIVPGGGHTLVHAIEVLKDTPEPVKEILRIALSEPLRCIVHNAGEDPEAVLNRTLKSIGPFGFNALTLTWGDLIEQGVIDPVKVIKVALRNAISVAGMMLTCRTVITNETEEERKSRLPGKQ